MASAKQPNVPVKSVPGGTAMPFFLLGGLALVWLVTRKSAPPTTTPAPMPTPTPAPQPSAPIPNITIVAPAPSHPTIQTTPPFEATNPVGPFVSRPFAGIPRALPPTPGQTPVPPTVVVPAAPRSPTPPASTPTSSSGPSGPNAAILAQCFQLTNAARAAGQNCADGTGWNPAQPAYRWNATLARVAQQHSDWMAANKTLSHQDPTGNPGQRITAAGYQWQHMAENVAMGAQSAAEAVNGWLASTDGHCANIMSGKSDEIGIGVARASDGTLFWTQDFAKSLSG